ncbi:hypothetical protein JHK86_035201 [Glycine max]|nr:hypothetical protein JHK86_035201 [Glycine max]
MALDLQGFLLVVRMLEKVREFSVDKVIQEIELLTRDAERVHREPLKRILEDNQQSTCRVWVSMEALTLRHDFEIPNGENARDWVANLVLKFHNDPTENESKIIIFLRHVWWSAGKERLRRKNEIER